MNESTPITVFWNEIDLAESYLVCCMYDAASSLSVSLLKRACEVICSDPEDASQCHQIMESAGMVLVQSWKVLGRTAEIFKHFRCLYRSITDIPFSVLLTGACFQLIEGGVDANLLKEFLEEYIGEWKYMESHYQSGHSVLETHEYAEIVEIYVNLLLQSPSNDVNHVMTWLEKIVLPDEEHHILLERVRCVARSRQRAVDVALQELKSQTGSPPSTQLPTFHHSYRVQLRSLEPVSWFFGKLQLYPLYAASHGRIAMGILVILAFFLVRRKRAVVGRHDGTLTRPLMDLWHLAFSPQINPLAAVHQTTFSRR